MLHQNFKGLLTLVLIFTLLVGGFYLYKSIIEPKFISTDTITQYPISEEIEINPKIEISENKVVISWETPFESTGAVMYCIKGNTANCEEVASQNKNKKHTITLENLNPETKYSYKISIDNKYYPMDEASYFNFETLADTENKNTEINNKKTTLVRPTAVSTPKPSTSSNSKTSSLAEFRNAIKNQDLKYDTNKDGKVDTSDYIP